MEITEATRSEDAALAWLERLSGSGARVICIYGWWEKPPNPFALQSTGAVPAMRRWLEQ